MKIAIIYGGTSSERLPSEKNARGVFESLKRRGYDAEMINYDARMPDKLKTDRPDIVFLCVQGKYHGDGTLQAILDFMHIPYTGSDTSAAALINDKIKCKVFFDRYGHRTPEWFAVTRKQFESRGADFGQIGYPFVAKAPTQGGSFGIALVRNETEIGNMAAAFEFDDTVLAEGFVDGRAYTVGVLERDGELCALPCVEMIDKRIDKNDGLILMTGEYSACVAELPQELKSEMENMACDIFTETGARDYARIDFMVDGNDMKVNVIEINAVPGLKPESLLPIEAEIAGIGYDDLIEGILLNAARRNGIC